MTRRTLLRCCATLRCCFTLRCAALRCAALLRYAALAPLPLLLHAFADPDGRRWIYQLIFNRLVCVADGLELIGM
jgi:hypothetical protein